MKRRIIPQALFGALLSLLFLSGCTTLETRIQERPEAFRSLSPSDQALVQQGKIREGMSQDAVYIAWGPPSHRVPGRNRGRIVETWVYDATAAGDYGGPFFYGSRYGHGIGYGMYGGRRGRFGYRHHFYDPFYDPFFYNRANIVRYPERTVSFQNGRAIAFQQLPPPRFY
ncbi:MAG TPA: hypothetical protein VNP98_16005 [Chthoniobacterales bacterium]|nr:hypothetical protein [Chthoniobacterales bacterium]